jgi:hypothetical protein
MPKLRQRKTRAVSSSRSMVSGNKNNFSNLTLNKNCKKDTMEHDFKKKTVHCNQCHSNTYSYAHCLLVFFLSGIVWVPLSILVYIRQERLPRSILPNNNNTSLSWRETIFLQTSRGCTLDNCIDWSRCKNSTSFYIYKDTDINFLENNIVKYFGKKEELKKFNRLVVDILKKSPDLNVVDDPNKACFFIPRIACISVGKCDIYEGFAELRLRNLRYWNNGYNHILIDYSDDRFGLISGGPGSLEIHLRSGSSTHFFRSIFDISLPLLPKKSLWKTVVRKGKRAKDREILLSFRGSLSDESRSIERTQSLGRTSPNNVSEILRRKLKKLHNGKDILIQVGHLDRKQLNNPGYWSSYSTQLLESKFQLIPRGLGLHSHRLLESIRAGSIPVLLSDGYVLPFDSIIPWEKAIIRIPEIEFQSIPEILSAIDSKRMHQLQCNGLHIYHQYFMRPGGSMELAFRILKSRIVNHNRYEGNKTSHFQILRGWPVNRAPEFVPFCNRTDITI